MTYARSRLWLGISGVGCIVVLSSILLVTGLPLKVLPSGTTWSAGDVVALLSMIGLLFAALLPLDLLGGLLLPNRSRPQTITPVAFVTSWIRGVVTQGAMFLAASVLILAGGRAFGLGGATVAVLGLAIMLLAFQLPIAKWTGSLQSVDESEGKPDGSISKGKSSAAMDAAVEQTSQWGFKRKPVLILKHQDSGFTGGIVGLPGMESLVIPAVLLEKLSTDQLAVVIARRLEAIQSGGRTRGILLALAWVLGGFVLSASLPGAGVASVGELAMTCLGFTLWTFLGLLTLPTLSRQAAYAIDRTMLDRGATPETLHSAVQTLDRLQDDEPERSAWIETIFHPVPSVNNRRGEAASQWPIAWHAARMTLFVSWACMGMLVRAVHCNVGRPELWVMLPTD
ncbi:MAG: hypothetical protein AAF958_10335 [Planctomycetota bacterium]